MLVLIGEAKENISVIEIVLEQDPEDKYREYERLHMWHCPTCKTPVFQYKGRIVSIMPNISNLKLPVVVRCNRCGQKYVIVRMI